MVEGGVKVRKCRERISLRPKMYQVSGTILQGLSLVHRLGGTEFGWDRSTTEILHVHMSHAGHFVFSRFREISRLELRPVSTFFGFLFFVLLAFAFCG